MALRSHVQVAEVLNSPLHESLLLSRYIQSHSIKTKIVSLHIHSQLFTFSDIVHIHSHVFLAEDSRLWLVRASILRFQLFQKISSSIPKTGLSSPWRLLTHLVGRPKYKIQSRLFVAEDSELWKVVPASSLSFDVHFENREIISLERSGPAPMLGWRQSVPFLQYIYKLLPARRTPDESIGLLGGPPSQDWRQY